MLCARRDERLSAALTLVVAGARPGGVYLAAVILALRVDFGIAVDLAGRGEQGGDAKLPGALEHIHRADHADRIGHPTDQKVCAALVERSGEIRATVGGEIVERDDLKAFSDQPLTDVRAEKPGTTCDENPLHTQLLLQPSVQRLQRGRAGRDHTDIRQPPEGGAELGANGSACGVVPRSSATRSSATLGAELAPHERRVHAAPAQELVVAPDLHDGAVPHHGDAIGAHDRGGAMGDDERGPAGGDSIDRLRHEGLARDVLVFLFEMRS